MRKLIKPVKKSKKEEPQILTRKGVFKKPNNTINKKRRLDVVIVSVNYNDLVLVSLINNVKIFDNITIVTSTEDKMCQQICKKFGVKCVVTDSMYDSGAKFNRGKAINEGIKSLNDPDYILIIDADIVVKNKINLESLNEDYLYTSDRWICKSYGLYKQWKNGNIELNKIGSNESDRGIGFFQLFNINNKNIDKDKPYPETSNDAAFDDLLFRDKFVNRTKIEENTIIHLGDPYINWSGRVTMRFLSDDEFTENYEKVSSILKISNRDQNIKPKLAVITTFFNPKNYINLKYNYLKFSEKIKEKADLFPIELSFNGDFFIEDKNVIQINGSEENILWQKERLLNIVLEKLPKEYTNVAWVDCDIIFENENWIDELNEKLKSYKVVQLYEYADRLSKKDEVEKVSMSIIKRIDEINKIDINLSLGIPGFAWTIRRECIDKIKFLDTQIIGGGDSLMFYSFFGISKGIVSNQMNKEWFDVFKKWYNESYNEINCSVSYISGRIKHLYHGEIINRKYNTRYKLLSENGFDPNIDMKINESGLWEIKNKNISECLSNYFIDRDEDDNIIDINKYFDKIYVLNLDRRMDRFESIKNKLEKLEIEFERFSAIDGNNISDGEYDFSNFKQGKGMLENKYALACLKSHFKIIKDAKENNYKRILIFEDDVLISKNIKVHIQKIRNIKKWKLIYLGSSQYDWNLDFIEDFYLSRKSLGTFAYAIDMSIYDDILNLEISKSVDNLLSDIQYTYYGECFTFYPNVCISDVTESDIRNSRLQKPHNEKMRWNLNDYI
jgi:GR25 family glycosyltransferase involved in LPS biosynthesis/GTP:adenosylcobinamide-phosphate guanylyltransferase